MKRLILSVLVSCALFGSALSVLEEERDQVFAEDGESRMKPAKTLQILKKLSIAYGRDNCPDCEKMKREVDRLIATSEATEDKCTQKSVNYINKLIRVYSKSQLNLIPFLQYYKKQLIEICQDQFDVTSLRWESVGSSYPNDNLDSSSDVDNTSDSNINDGKNRTGNDGETKGQLKNTISDRERVPEFKKKRDEEYLLNLERHREANENWMKRYNEVLFGTSHSKEPKKLLDTLIQLDKDRLSTFGLSDSIKRKLDNLIGLRYFSVFSCNRKQFNAFKALTSEFGQGYNPSIMRYINHYRDAFWRKCKSSFLEGQNRKPFFEKDQFEVFSLVDHVFASNGDQENKGRFMNDQSTIIREGLLSYSKEKLVKRPYDEDELNSLFEDTIEPACESVELRFKDSRELGEIVDENRDFENDLDEMSLKWLKALKVCNSINDNPELLGQARAYFSQTVRND